MKQIFKHLSSIYLIPLLLVFVGLVLAIFTPSSYHSTNSSAATISIVPTIINTCCPINPRMGIMCPANRLPCITTTAVPSITPTIKPCCPNRIGTIAILCALGTTPCPTITASIPVPTISPTCCPTTQSRLPCRVIGSIVCVSPTVTPTTVIPHCCPSGNIPCTTTDLKSVVCPSPIVTISVSPTILCCPSTPGKTCKIMSAVCAHPTQTPSLTIQETVTPTVLCCPREKEVLCARTTKICPSTSTTPQVTTPCCLNTTSEVSCKTKITCPETGKNLTGIIAKPETIPKSPTFVQTFWNSIQSFFIHLF